VRKWKPVEHVTEQAMARGCHVATDPLREPLVRNKDDVFEKGQRSRTGVFGEGTETKLARRSRPQADRSR